MINQQKQTINQKKENLNRRSLILSMALIGATTLAFGKKKGSGVQAEKNLNPVILLLQWRILLALRWSETSVILPHRPTKKQKSQTTNVLVLIRLYWVNLAVGKASVLVPIWKPLKWLDLTRQVGRRRSFQEDMMGRPDNLDPIQLETLNNPPVRQGNPTDIMKRISRWPITSSTCWRNWLADTPIPLHAVS